MKGRPMTLVTAQMSVSLDGYYAGPRQGDADTSDLQSWLNGPEAAGFFRVTRWAIDAEAWRQCLGFSGGEKRLLDELHIAPVILGDGMRLLDHQLELDTSEEIELTPDRVTATDDVTHIRYRVRERRPVLPDDRGNDEQARPAA